MEVFLKGNYKSFTKLRVFRPKKKVSVVVLMVHGLYSETGTPRSKSKILGKKILEKNIANVVQFSSSRDWNIFPSDGEYSKQQKAFEGKTFQQEANDLRDSIDFIIDQSKYLFGIEGKDIKFYIVANSIGGTVTSTLKDKFKYIDKIVLAGSGTRSSDSAKPILSTCPAEKEILSCASSFIGSMLLLQGGLDIVVPIDSQNKLFESYKKAKAKKIVIEGANHSFSEIKGKNKKLAYKLYIDNIIQFLSL